MGTTRGAVTFYSIPRFTLKHRILGTRGKGSTSRDSKGGGGVESFLSATEEEETFSQQAVSSEIAANLTNTAPLKVATIPTATVPQGVVSCLTDAVPPEVAIPSGGVLLQAEQASTSTVANPPGVASISKEKKLKQAAKEKKKGLEKMNISKPDAKNKIKRKKLNNTDDKTTEESDQLTVLRDNDDDYDFMNHSDEEIDEHDNLSPITQANQRSIPPAKSWSKVISPQQSSTSVNVKSSTSDAVSTGKNYYLVLETLHVYLSAIGKPLTSVAGTLRKKIASRTKVKQTGFVKYEVEAITKTFETRTILADSMHLLPNMVSHVVNVIPLQPTTETISSSDLSAAIVNNLLTDLLLANLPNRTIESSVMEGNVVEYLERVEELCLSRNYTKTQTALKLPTTLACYWNYTDANDAGKQNQVDKRPSGAPIPSYSHLRDGHPWSSSRI
ncbi:hypothetical protein ILUMI_25802 [Ignelater luminosus]|uniref:Uncharacterized protein n=1 Tax=Ignelater luminosus TaxID=2038154 RepID=A0A8K0C7S7_IGNLU|nr:hypothetical protein ILUMI_25802 [Ignelater luminosus]